MPWSRKRARAACMHMLNVSGDKARLNLILVRFALECEPEKCPMFWQNLDVKVGVL